MENLKKTLASLPREPGVYIYRNAKHIVIYVGKAVDLSRRVRQYFHHDASVDEKTKRLVGEIDTIQTIPTTSEFDALLLEAKLIRQYLPKFNIVSRDDKSYLYVVITLSEDLPRLLLVRKGALSLYEQHKKNAIYGPFQSASALRSLLRQLRSIVPYCTQKERRGKSCFYTHLGLCDPCPGAIVNLEGDAQEAAIRRYRTNMFRLHALFQGKTARVAREYEKEMHRYADRLAFEKAAVIKERLRYLNGVSAYRYDPMVFLEQGATDIYREELSQLLLRMQQYYPHLQSLHRIECYDISQLMGKQAAGSMTVLHDGRPEKREYRKFRITSVKGISDVAMMREVLSRRLSHTEWPFPNLMIVDGGKPQVEAAKTVLTALGIAVPLVGLAKREEELIIPTEKGYAILRLPLSGRAIKVVQRIRDEAHRFAISYHRHLRAKAFNEVMTNVQV